MTNQVNSWDSFWKNESDIDYWLEPDPVVVRLVEKLVKAKVRDVLDLGCGVGRHALCLAQAGFTVTAVDISESAVAVLRKRVGDNKGVRIISGAYSGELFVDNSFDLVLSWNVLYHGNREDFIKATRFIHKWLRPDGIFFFTCPTRRDAKYGNGEEIAPNTYCPLNSIHPGDIHYFADEADIAEFLCGFELISKEVNEHYWDNNGTRQFSSYWQLLAKRQDSAVDPGI